MCGGEREKRAGIREPPGGAARTRQRPPLHAHERHGSGATATEDWYETERLTGHITGRAPTNTVASPPTSTEDELPAILDWRQTEVLPAPNLLERLSRNISSRRLRPRQGKLATPTDVDAQAPPPPGEPQPHVLVAPSETAYSPASLDQAASTPPLPAESSTPRIALRGAPEQPPQRPRRPRAFSTSIHEHHAHQAPSRRTLTAGAVLLALIAVAALGITRIWASPPRASSTSTSRPSAGTSTLPAEVHRLLHAVAPRVGGTRLVSSHHSRRPARTDRHATRQRSRAAGSSSTPPPTSSSQPTIATAGRAPSTDGGTGSGGSGNNGGTPAYTTTTPTRPAPQPAGPAGPGGTVGGNCNPKCS